MTGGIIMVVIRASFLQFILKNAGRDPCRMVEHEPASVDSRGEQDTSACQCEDDRRGSFTGSHPAFPEDPPQRQHAEDAQGDQAQGLVRLHDPVDGVAMRDVLFRLKTGDHRGYAAHRAEYQSPEAHQPERFPFRGNCEYVEQCDPEEQGGWKIVQSGVQARPIVAEHVNPLKA